MVSRAENLSHRCKSLPTGTLSAKINDNEEEEEDDDNEEEEHNEEEEGNLSHRCKSVPTGTLSANFLTASKQGVRTASKMRGKKEQSDVLATFLLGWK